MTGKDPNEFFHTFKGAKGNTSMEDLVFVFEEMGISTGVKMDALKNSMAWVGCSGPKRNP
jgi:hypothetical protein